MPRYFFDTDNGERVRRDDHGCVLTDLDAAEAEAAGLLRDLAHGVAPYGSSVFACTVRGEDDAPVYRITMVVQGQRVV